MYTYVGRRVAQGAVSLVAVALLVFAAVRLTGDPALLYLPLNASAETRREFDQARGFNDPILVQLLHYLQGVGHGDFGLSLTQGVPALHVVLLHFPNTLLLAGLGVGCALVLSVTLGALCAARPMSALDRAISAVALSCASIPDFWLALVLVFVFAVRLEVVPTSGIGDWTHWILPVVTITARPFGQLSQVVRGAMVDAMASPYVATGRSKGISETRILFVHALRNAGLPIITIAGDTAVGFVNGAIIVETVFGIPGVGKLLIDSINNRDFAVVQADVIVTGTTIILLNILIDLLYLRVNPRIRVGSVEVA